MKIAKFSDIKNTLFIFDLDDTLVSTPSFEDLSIKFLKEGVSIKSLLRDSVRRIGVDISDLKWENGRIYVQDPNQELDIKGNWVRKKTRVYLVPPNKFYYSDLSLPTKPKREIAKLYKLVDNKCIVTGRPESMKEKITLILDKFDLGIPNYGVHCYPTKSIINDKIAIWKGNTIVKLIKDNSFKKAVFYEDNSKWINKVTEIVKKELPEIEWKSYKV